MKRFLLLISLIIILSIFGITKEKKFFAGADLNLLFHADSTFKKVYSKSIAVPEFKAGYYLSRNFLIWGGYEFFKKSGKTPELSVKVESKQSFLSFGAGYSKGVGEKANVTILAGICSISYEEEAFDEKVSGSKVGLRVDALFQYSLTDSIYSEVGAGYIGASDSLDSGVDFKLGGVRVLVGFGIRF